MGILLSIRFLMMLAMDDAQKIGLPTIDKTDQKAKKYEPQSEALNDRCEK